MQKVELYNSMLDAKFGIEKEIHHGWRVHTCTATACKLSYYPSEKVLVVYEKDG